MDLVGHIIFNDKDEEVFNFGKHKGKRVKDVFKRTLLLFWIMDAEFPLYTKGWFREFMMKYNLKKNQADYGQKTTYNSNRNDSALFDFFDQKAKSKSRQCRFLKWILLMNLEEVERALFSELQNEYKKTKMPKIIPETVILGNPGIKPWKVWKQIIIPKLIP